jgi:hypothetical protein
MDMKQITWIVRCWLLLCTALPLMAEAWNPYDTDSARGRGYDYSDDYGSAGFYGTPASPPGWERRPGRGTTDDRARSQEGWGDSDWYASDPRRSNQAWRQGTEAGAPDRGPADAYGGQDGYRDYGGYGDYRDGGSGSDAGAQSGYTGDRSWGGAGPQWDAPAAGGIWQPPEQSGWSAPRQRQYRFRTDPELDALSGRGNAAEGFRYRPLSDREQERQARQPGGYPEFRARDLQPQGPWRSFQDEGTAFGYHPEAPYQQPNGGQPW